MYKKINIDGMSKEELYKSAFDKMVLSVSTAEQSSLKMRDKLLRKGYPEETVDKVISRAIEIRAIDDIRYSEALIRSTLAMGKGMFFAQREIESLGVEIESLDAYQDYLEAGEDAQLESALRFLRSHPPRSKNIFNSAYRKLVNKGFSPSIASQASKVYADCLSDE